MRPRLLVRAAAATSRRTLRTAGQGSYRCRSFSFHTGECGARFFADAVGAEIVRYVDQLIAEFESWPQRVLATAGVRARGGGADARQALWDLHRLDRRARKIE